MSRSLTEAIDGGREGGREDREQFAESAKDENGRMASELRSCQHTLARRRRDLISEGSGRSGDGDLVLRCDHENVTRDYSRNIDASIFRGAISSGHATLYPPPNFPIENPCDGQRRSPLLLPSAR